MEIRGIEALKTEIQSPYLNTANAGKYLGIAPTTLAIWRCRKKGPKFVLAGTRVRYRIADLDAFVDSCHTQKRVSPNVGRPPQKNAKAARRSRSAR
jgi:hypothetical protein